MNIDLEVVFAPILQDLPENLEAQEPPAANKPYLPDPDLLDDTTSRLRDGLVTSLVLMAGRDPPVRLVVNLKDRAP